MKPETILRAYRGTLVAVEQGWQGVQRHRRARQRNRFLMWLTRWSERATDSASQATIKRKGGQ